MPPFVYPTPQINPYAASVGELMLHGGEIRANEALGLANANAQAVSGVAGDAASTIQQLNDPKQILARQQVTDLKTLDAAFSKPGGRDQILASLPGHLRGQVAASFQSADESAAKVQKAQVEAEQANQDYVFGLAQQIKANNYEPSVAQLAISHAKQTFASNPSLLNTVGQMEDALHANPTAQGVQAMTDPFIAAKEAQEKPVVLPGAVRPGAAPSTLVRPTSGAVVATGAQAEPVAPPRPTEASIALDASKGDPAAAMSLLKPPIAKTDPLDEPITVKTVENGKNVEKVMTKREAIAQGSFQSQPPAVTGNAEQEQSNARTVAQSYKDGTGDMNLLESTRGTSQGMALLAEMKRQGLDANQMTRDWTATKSAIRSLDSPQQLRLAEVINKASDSLNKVESLNQEWQAVGARFGVKAFNRVSLTAAQNGFYGPQAASVAQRLDAQIADVTSELGQGVMGGGSPTDHALALASKNLSTDWTQPVLNDSIKQVRYNLNLAQNARNDILQGLGVTSTQVKMPQGGGAPQKGETRPITDPGYPPGAEQTFNGSTWIRTK